LLLQRDRTAEWAAAQRNVDGGSAPISLTEEQIREQNKIGVHSRQPASRYHSTLNGDCTQD
jgi:hypothetical protein